jgi:hypothetical protein
MTAIISNAIMDTYNKNCNLITIVMTVAIVFTILHIFVPALDRNIIAILCVVLLLASSLLSANAGWVLFTDNSKNNKVHSSIKKAITRNAILSGVLSFILGAAALMLIIRTVE